MTITPGKLRALTQPTIILRMDAPVEPAPGEPSSGPVFRAGDFVFAQYIGNGRLLLTPIDPVTWPATVVMASALNTTSTIPSGADIVQAFKGWEHTES